MVDIRLLTYSMPYIVIAALVGPPAYDFLRRHIGRSHKEKPGGLEANVESQPLPKPTHSAATGINYGARQPQQ